MDSPSHSRYEKPLKKKRTFLGPSKLKRPPNTNNNSNKKVVTETNNEEDLHMIEKQMMTEMGFYRPNGLAKPQQSVETLLQTYRQNKQRRNSNEDDQDQDESIGGVHDPSPSSTLDVGLVSSLTKRLTALERLCSEQRAYITASDKTTRSLKFKLSSYETNANVEEMYQLKQQNDRLRRQTHEMETFLNDYGLVWVGYRAADEEQQQPQPQAQTTTTTTTTAKFTGKGHRLNADSSTNSTNDASTTVDLSLTQIDQEERDSPLFRLEKKGFKTAEKFAVNKAISSSNSSSTTPQSQPPQPQGTKEIYFSMDAMKKALIDINSIATQGQMKLVRRDNMHKLELQRSLDLCFYKNGIFFKNGPLRPYSMPECQAFVKDILDGYFPYELKDEYPGGVVFSYTDKSTETWTSTGMKTDGKAMTGNTNNKNEFLRNLPKTTISNGKVIDLRSQLGIKKSDTMIGRSQNLILVKTPTVELLSIKTNRPQTPRDIATLRVKLDDGTPMLLLKMRFQDTIQSVKQFILEEMKRNNNNNNKNSSSSSQRRQRRPEPSMYTFELRTNFPAKVYNNDAQTLHQAGLAPNANLFVRTLS